MSSYAASFAPAGGLHPTLQLSIVPSAAPHPSCAFYTLVDVPPALIADRYQLLQLQRGGRLGARGEGAFVHEGEGDLEAPVWRAEGARVLLRLRDAGAGKGTVRGQGGETRLSVDIPLHLRYQNPVKRRWVEGVRSDTRSVEVEWPWVFWSCEADERRATSACPPTALPHLDSFAPLSSTTLHFLPTNGSQHSSSVNCPPPRPPPLTLAAPTGVLDDLPMVESITAAAVWGCFAFLCWTAVLTYRRARAVNKEKAA